MQPNDQNHVPDVLFVDEDGNPIEPGRENIIYVDENGTQIPEQVALQLLESGKYVDSRELVNSAAARKTMSSSANSSQALYQAQMEAKMQAMALAEAQAQVFAKAQAELKQREEELASIEADAARGDTPVSLRQKTSNSANSDSLGATFAQQGELEARLQAQRIAELREHEILREKLLQRQRQIMQEQFQHRVSRQTEQSPYGQQQISNATSGQAQTQSFQAETKLQAEPSFSALMAQQEQLDSTVHTEEPLVNTSKSNTPVNFNAADSQAIKEFGHKFSIGQVKLVGYLTGDNVIRNAGQLSAQEVEKIYQEAMRDQTESESGEEKKDEQLDDGVFGDELVEIDFGPIDAYTAALNAHLNAHRNASEVDDNKKFAAHVLTCSHATFIDNQLVLGEPMYNTFERNDIVNGTSGVNVELYEPEEDANQGLDRNTLSRTNTQVEYDQGNYSQSQSFASIIDIQSQRGYSIRDMNQYQESNFSKEDSRANFDSYFDSIRSKQSNAAFYANTDNLNTKYVSR
ncbi:hypothetical protein BpHYR1_003418 [Brachionus plicatilis]|uniref:Uncharacterized protein n=1 Tax=Brachionus plicatilis TaxID=10195 RepID=A0A3M7RCS8_BRAPC|nr:hypothetical protein BpHYR1_003418 [Brachionus plicatilis]